MPFRGLDKAQRGLMSTAANAGTIAGGGLVRAGVRAVNELRSEWPIATGRSAAAFDVVTDGDGAAIVNATRYAEFVGDGLAERRIPAILEKNTPQLDADVDAQLTRSLSGGS